MNTAGSVWSFTSSQEWTQEEGGNFQRAMQVIRHLIERHGDAIRLNMNDMNDSNIIAVARRDRDSGLHATGLDDPLAFW